MKSEEPSLLVGKVDTDSNQRMIDKFNVTELPTLLYLDEEGGVHKYDQAERNVALLRDFVKGKQGKLQGSAPAPSPSLTVEGALELTDQKTALLDQGKWILFATGSWCDMCDKFKPSLQKMVSYAGISPALFLSLSHALQAPKRG